MEIITANELSKKAADLWKHQYFNKDVPGWFVFRDGLNAEERYKKACEAARHVNTRVSKITEALGDKSWTHPYCDECYQYVKRAVRFELHGEGGATLCKPCLVSALTRLEG